MSPHTPVMLAEVLRCLDPQEHALYVDATFGGGGYTQAFLEAANCQVIAFDRDPQAIAQALILQQSFAERLRVVEAPFSEMTRSLKKLGVQEVQGIVLDVGVSSWQIDEPERGFSLRFDGPLNMRMDQDQTKLSAYTVVNRFPEKELANILYQYGQERRSRAIARAIINARQKQPLQTTLDLANLVKSVMKGWRFAEHPATRTFQALRIFVNDELRQLERTLSQSVQLLADAGRLIVVTFHSLEDRLVKELLRQYQKSATGYFVPLQKKPLVPHPEEIVQNPRARSAKLRAAIWHKSTPCIV